MRLAVVNEDGLWIAHSLTRHGHMELFCGEGDRPDVRAVRLAEQFLEDAVDHLAAVRRSVFALPKLRLGVPDAARRRRAG